MKRSLFLLQILGMIGLAIASVLLMIGLFGDVHPAFDSFAHFRAHLAVASAVLAVLLLFGRFRLYALAGVVFAIACFTTTSTMLADLGLGPVQARFEVRSDEQPVYRLLQMNLRFNNPTPVKVLSLVGRIQPDVITLDEVSDMWKGKLQLLSHAYPYQLICPYPNLVFGVAILSRRPFKEGTEPACFARGALAVAAVDLGGTTADVAAIHLSWPWPFEQPWQLSHLAEPLSRLGETAIMAGDCNATPWSAAVRRVARAGGLKIMASAGPTWQYMKLPEMLRFAGLPIDQVFSKGDIFVNSIRTLASTGSDHLPVLVEFSIKQQAPKPDEPETATADANAVRRGAAG
ncbi:endonuclease/exonuclease/phosphatase family protein [Mesorhizobium sp. BE184]|uniref:endonuclease/exonuclease/phosphatase family protein n=1 Tax=Mesorhizobium sp. BE184 TaxID=2817714 RepID=UPI002864FE26|nr:endonuclease/exonuclease/phosphatase family protein [Mesorhizobium sp. BE184]MDR7031754.1 endonuclease/exonuclease/phosphatase (EEP) superfamily protein YafD [Mesorhizobium sp. BE184]